MWSYSSLGKAVGDNKSRFLQTGCPSCHSSTDVKVLNGLHTKSSSFTDPPGIDCCQVVDASTIRGRGDAEKHGSDNYVTWLQCTECAHMLSVTVMMWYSIVYSGSDAVHSMALNCSFYGGMHHWSHCCLLLDPTLYVCHLSHCRCSNDWCTGTAGETAEWDCTSCKENRNCVSC